MSQECFTNAPNVKGCCVQPCVDNSVDCCTRSQSSIFKNQDFSGLTRLGHKKLTGIDFTNSNMTGAIFLGLDLTSTNFTNADLQNVDFSDTILDSVDFRGAKNMSTVNYDKNTYLSGVYMPNGKLCKDKACALENLQPPNPCAPNANCRQVKCTCPGEKVCMFTETDGVGKCLSRSALPDGKGQTQERLKIQGRKITSMYDRSNPNADTTCKLNNGSDGFRVDSPGYCCPPSAFNTVDVANDLAADCENRCSQQ